MTESKPKYILEYSVFDESENSHLVSGFSTVQFFNSSMNVDIFGLKFNVSEESEIPDAVKLLKQLLQQIEKPLMIRGSGNKAIDIKLIPALTKALNRPSIVAYADENTYQEIVPEIIKGSHTLVIRTPIDINLAKEMNILTTEMGLATDKIIMDPDMGGLGYGLEYGYSIIEKIKQVAPTDKMLDMPIIAFVGEESLKTKEAKSDTFDKNWGDFKLRSEMFEIATASAMKAAGADYLVMNYPPNIEKMKGLEV